jgi:hypothetical protein
MSNFKRLDFLDTCAKDIDAISSMSEQSLFLFNISDTDDLDMNKKVVHSLSVYLQKELTNIEKEDCKVIKLSEIDFKNLSALPKVCIFDFSNMNYTNIGIISSQARNLKKTSGKIYVFHCNNSKHLEIASGFEPFQLRDRVFFNLDEDLIKYASYQELSENIPEKNKEVKRKIKI